MRNPVTLAKRAVVTHKSAVAFLRDQAVAQITKKILKPREEDYTSTGGAHGEYLADLIYLRDYERVYK